MAEGLQPDLIIADLGFAKAAAGQQFKGFCNRGMCRCSS